MEPGNNVNLPTSLTSHRRAILIFLERTEATVIGDAADVWKWYSGLQAVLLRAASPFCDHLFSVCRGARGRRDEMSAPPTLMHTTPASNESQLELWPRHHPELLLNSAFPCRGHSVLLPQLRPSIPNLRVRPPSPWCFCCLVALNVSRSKILI